MSKLPYNEVKVSGLVRKLPFNDGKNGLKYDLFIGQCPISNLKQFIEENFKGEEVTIIVRKSEFGGIAIQL